MIWGNVCPIHPELEGERYNGGNCPECVKITKAAYNERTRERRLAEMKKYRERNADKLKRQNAEWVKTNRDRVRCSNLRRTGFTLKLKQACIEAQKNLCAICGVDLTTLPARQVHADHCHETGQPRGVLCHHCNTGLGGFVDRIDLLEKAIAYLKNPTLEPLV